MNTFKILYDSLQKHARKLDTYTVAAFFGASVTVAFLFFCMYQTTRRRSDEDELPRGNSEKNNQKSIASRINGGKRKKRFGKKDILAEERNRLKAEKREESKAERLKQKKAEGQTRQYQKSSFKNNGLNAVENSGGLHRSQQVVKRNGPHKRS